MASGMGKFLEEKALERSVGKAADFKPEKFYAALWTAALTAASTGATAGEAAYTSYARVEIPTTEWVLSGSGGPMVLKNKAAIKFPTCTGSESKVKFVMLTDKATVGEGDNLYWAEVTEFTINTTNKEPEIAAEALELKLT